MREQDYAKYIQWDEKWMGGRQKKGKRIKKKIILCKMLAAKQHKRGETTKCYLNLSIK